MIMDACQACGQDKTGATSGKYLVGLYEPRPSIGS